MDRSEPTLFFDYVDPLSYLLEHELEGVLDAEGSHTLRRLPLELRPPPAPLLDTDDPWWLRRWAAAAELAACRGVPLAGPGLIPWTRKAHELVLHARAQGVGEDAHHGVFEAVFVRGEDVGRVDVLVDLAEGLGLDPTATRVVLDVDRYAAEVGSARAEAALLGVAEPPALARGGRVLQGFHNREALRTFLLR